MSNGKKLGVTLAVMALIVILVFLLFVASDDFTDLIRFKWFGRDQRVPIHFVGLVCDQDGNPLSDVAITYTGGPKPGEVKTNAQGIFEIGGFDGHMIDIHIFHRAGRESSQL
ncbi:MAG: hypothetical protein ABIF71_03315 [Planctomycetota bacterium]